jgi:uncharacterized protein (TIGR00730 family)
MKKVCVFCGSASGSRPSYGEAARAFGRALAAARLGLVYGGSSIGLMGMVADEALAAGTEVHGVIPDFMVPKEIAHRGLTELHVTDSMHSRKAKMASLADAFVALPGGFGTLDELAEIFTWRQLGLHHKPIGILNIDGYFDSFVDFCDQAVTEGFVKAEHRALLQVSADPAALLATLLGLPPII